MSQSAEDGSHPANDPLPDPTAPDWVPLPADATQPIDPGVTSALPVPTPPSRPPSTPPAAPANPYAGPPAPPSGAPTPYSYDSPLPPGSHPSAPTAYGQGSSPNPYAAPSPQPPAPTNPYATGVPTGYPQPQGPVSYGYQQVPQRRTNASAIVLLVLSGLMVLCLVQIPATILAIVALTKQNDDPEASRRLTTYGWIAFGVGIVIAVVVAALLAASGVIVHGSPSGGSSI